ncbi:glycoside hydrolase family 127 protein [Prolixibacteraceae bacterium Z1-6]|uniref:Glycoside hydrolase family 127 protein n=1 Tax=Draconibacterium aestuarii TaxID=2998507 RepID=A0A9X3FB78_9BACT|nr:glycoside hydrolase family 127 protein [Prolixibacteraceae bacterium Z1-6]
MKMRFLTIIIGFTLFAGVLSAQEKGLTNNSKSPFIKLKSVNIGDVNWTSGFWAERFEVCKTSMVPHMMGCYLDEDVSHAFKNFEIAAGLDEGEHVGPPFHDGDFYKMLEAEVMVYAQSKDKKLEEQIDDIIQVIGKAQREDGYIHTPTSIKEMHNPDQKHEFNERLDFETYNMGHLMTAACIYYRISGKTELLDIAKKATDFLYLFFKTATAELARNAICPSHYMGVTEMYRTTGDPKYLELARSLVEIRSMVEDGTDHNQDRIPFKQQTKAVGHAVRANYLYAGVADVYAETGDDSLLIAMEKIWQDLTQTKMYITGACGALYDGVSPNGTTYDQPSIQQVHQAYGSDYELPNITAHNESCANIGNLLWNWRMLQITGDAAYADVMETIMYNSLLAGVSLDGKGYFYANPLCVADEISHNLRWSKHREEYISYCNCCPPNTIRTIAEVQEYFYSKANDGLYINFYGSNELNTQLNGKKVKLEQETNYPWNGTIMITIDDFPAEKNLYLRIPEWAKTSEIKINGELLSSKITRGTYLKLSHHWKKGDKVEIDFDMPASLIEANPLVEETRNQVAVKRGPVVYCLESPDVPQNSRIFEYKIPSSASLTPVKTKLSDSNIVALEGTFLKENESSWKNTLYREIPDSKPETATIQLIPYFAWDNRGKSEMTVWIPLCR